MYCGRKHQELLDSQQYWHVFGRHSRIAVLNLDSLFRLASFFELQKESIYKLKNQLVLSDFSLKITLVTFILISTTIVQKPVNAADTSFSLDRSNQVFTDPDPEISFTRSSRMVDIEANLEESRYVPEQLKIGSVPIPRSPIPVEELYQKREASALLGTDEAFLEQKLAQESETSVPALPSSEQIQEILNEIDQVPERSFPIPFRNQGYSLSPGFTISNPNGYGADNNTVFIAADYQRRTRFTKTNDGEIGFGIGVGDSVNAVGVELAYTVNSLGSSTYLGSGAFSIKIHRRISEDMAVAVGWNQFLRIEDPKSPLDFPKNSYYGVVSKVFKTQEFIDDPFSRVAVTLGIGSGQFLNFDRINEAVIQGEEPTGLNVFGSVGVRVLQQASLVVEWTGQDLGVGVSIVPFKNIPIVITPAFRDITGAGDGTRFIMGTGISFQL